MKELFFIGVVIPESISEKIHAVKKAFAEKYMTHHGLYTIPHITLIPPFRETEEGLRQRISNSEIIANDTAPFEIALNGYGCFSSSVVFIRVIKNNNLDRLYMKLKEMHGEAPGSGPVFHPHITIAHRDLKPQQFKKAWQEYESGTFEDRFKCESISVLAHRNGRWEVEHTSSFKRTGF